MSVFSIFAPKPKWESKDSWKRRPAVKEVTDQETLFKIAQEATHGDARVQATLQLRDETKLNHLLQNPRKKSDWQERQKERHAAIVAHPRPDPAWLIEVATKSEDAELATAALERIPDTDKRSLAAVAAGWGQVSLKAMRRLDAEARLEALKNGVHSIEAREWAVGELTAVADLKEVLKTETTRRVCRAAVYQLLKLDGRKPYESEDEVAYVGKCEDEGILRIFAIGGYDKAVWRRAVAGIKSTELLVSVAQHGEFFAGKYAVEKIEDQAALAAVVEKTRDEAVALAAIEKLTDQKEISAVVPDLIAARKLDRVKALLPKLHDEEELTQLAHARTIHGAAVDPEIRKLIVARIEKRVHLKYLVDGLDEYDAVRIAAQERLDKVSRQGV